MKLTLLTGIAIFFCGAAFALSGSGTEDDPFFMYGVDIYNKDVSISESGYYKPAHRMNSLVAVCHKRYADGELYKFRAFFI